MTTPQSCPASEVLEQFVGSQLPEEQRHALEAHVEGCASCRDQVLGIYRSRATAATSATAAQGDAQLRPLLEAAKGPLPRGTAIGRYVLLDALGKGGMGIVYVAYDPELDRKLAIKLLQALPEPGSSPGTGGQARLLREAQAMARLSHPNVVPVFDVGTWQDRVFVAMELVAGQDLRAWSKEHKRGWRQVLEVYLQAGRGLQAAHDAGLIHRDFKPDNVLIGNDGRVRVMDFGLARQLGEVDPAATAVREELHSGPRALTEPLTQAGLVMGTPPYMAPEQYAGQPADARSDQFSFAVSLYESLYGERPFKGNARHREEATRWKVPERPADSQVPRWVRAVVLRGLSEYPSDRFPTIGELCAKLAKDPAARRRQWTFGAVGAAALLAAAVGGTRLYEQRAKVCAGAAERIAQAWSAAQREKAKAAFLATDRAYAADVWAQAGALLDRYAADWTATHTEACEATRVHGAQTDQVLAARMACLEERYGDLDALGRLFAQADAQTVEKSVQAAQALITPASCSQVNALRERVKPPPEEKREQVEKARRFLADVRAHEALGKFRPGAELAARALEEARAIGYPPLLAETLNQAGALHYWTANLDGAEQALDEALPIAEGQGQDEEVAKVLIRLMMVKAAKGSFDDAHRWNRLGAAKIARLGGSARLESWLHNNHGNVYAIEGKLPEAMAEYQEAIVASAQVGQGTRDEARARVNLGGTLRRLDRFDDALPHYQEALAIWQRSVGPHHPDTSYALNELGATYLNRAELEKAKEAFSRALEIREAALGKTHPSLSGPLAGMGETAFEEGRCKEALGHFARALKIDTSSPGGLRPHAGFSLTSTGNAYSALGDHPRALEHHRKALELRESLGKDYPDLRESYLAYGDALYAAGKVDEALKLHRKAVEFIERTMGETPMLAAALEGVARALTAKKDAAGALAAAKRALALREKQRTAPASMAVSLLRVAQARLASNQPADALQDLERATALVAEAHLSPKYRAELDATLARTAKKVGVSPERLAQLEQKAAESAAEAERRCSEGAAIAVETP